MCSSRICCHTKDFVTSKQSVRKKSTHFYSKKCTPIALRLNILLCGKYIITYLFKFVKCFVNFIIKKPFPRQGKAFWKEKTPPRILFLGGLRLSFKIRSPFLSDREPRPFQTYAFRRAWLSSSQGREAR